MSSRNYFFDDHDYIGAAEATRERQEREAREYQAAQDAKREEENRRAIEEYKRRRAEERAIRKAALLDELW